MEYQQASPATTFSSKLANGGGITGKHVYDGVFGGPVKPGSGMEDYREIFGGSATCSIPILDFPELKERNISMEARSLKPDYSVIFGGCGEADFAVPYEELFSKPKRAKSRPQETRAPAEGRCRSVGAKHSNSSAQKRAPSPEVSSLSFDELKQVNLSYNKSNPGSENGTIGTTHIAQLHAVPGYTCLIDEQATQQVSDGGKPVQTVLNDARLNVNASEGLKDGKSAPKAVSGPQPREPIKNTSTNNSEIQKKPRRHWSFANDVSFDKFEMGLGTQPSATSPSNVGCDIGSSIRSKFEDFRSDNSEGAAASYSPPLLDEEMDANSAAAASAAAVRKAIEEAQAKIKIAKELMERKKQGLQNHVKPSFNNGSKAKRREMKAAEKIHRSREMHLKDTPKQVFINLTEHDAQKQNQARLDLSNIKESFAVRAAIRESNSGQVDFWLQAESGITTEGFCIPTGVGEGREKALEVNQEVNAEKMRPSATGIESKEKMTGVEGIKKPVEVAFRWDIYRHNSKSAEEHQLEENEEIIRVVNDNNEAPRVPDMNYLQEACKSRRLSEPEEEAEFVTEELKEYIYRKEIKDAVDQVRNETSQGEGDNREEMEIHSNEVPREENEKGLDEIHWCEGNGRGQKEEFDRTVYEREQLVCEGKQQECCYQEENDKSQIGDLKLEGTRKLLQVHVEEVTGASLNSFQDEEDFQKRQRDNYGKESDENLVELTESESMLKEEYQMNEIGKHKIYEDVESERIQTEIHLRAEDNNNMEVAENETAVKTHEAYGEVKFEGAEVLADVAILENDRVFEHFYPKETGRGSKVAEEADDQQENVQTSETEQGLGLDRSKNQTADICLGETDLKFEHQQNKYHMTEFERVFKQEFNFEEVTSQSDENEKDVSDCEIGASGQGSESDFGSSNDDRWFGNGIDSDTLRNSQKQVEEAVCGLGETNQDARVPEVPINHNATYFESSSEEEWANNGIAVQASQQPHIFDREEKTMKVPQEDEEEKKVRVSQEGKTKQNIDKDENYQETQTTENKENEDNMQKEVELGSKHHARKEEMRMREMAKERERMAVERAIREVRERAYAEARERAAAKRTAAEARERSEKDCPDTNSKSAVEKESVEAKLRAQRAAVERATAEARERALEKALSEKASFKMRNQAEKSAAEKVSGASRNYGIKPNDQHNKSSGPSKSSGTDSELAERCKATFERNQRTAERAAKALAEKNMRDLLAQKEQAERNRLAEILDAEVKRWASGKERNLRALLSTLQYILGSDSGWQPVPLTDLISTAAVKKAYRKATLLVHPDKLQQRGASIQQKYTCEKVFDLLKDAWNKFSTEER